MTAASGHPWPPAGTPVLDQAALAILRDMQEPGEPDLLSETTTVFLADVSRRVSEIEAAIARSEAAAVRDAAHAIKGGAWIIGAMRLGQACAALEKDAAAGRLDDAWVWVRRLS